MNVAGRMLGRHRRPTADAAIYAVFDCYPRAGGEFFAGAVGAYAGCWLRSDGRDDARDVAGECRRLLALQGWETARLISSEMVDAASYRTKREGRDSFRTAMRSGWAIRTHSRQREYIRRSGRGRRPSIGAVVAAAAAVAANELVGLYNRTHRSWCAGEAPSSDGVVPVWSSREHAAAWATHFDGRAKALTSRGRAARSFLRDARDSDHWIALGVGPDVLVTVHPSWLAELCRAPVTGGSTGVRGANHANESRSDGRLENGWRTEA